MTIKALVVGAGGVGAVAALALESSNQVQVTVVARSFYDTLITRGFSYDSVNYGRIESWKPSNIVKTIGDADIMGNYDYVFVCTKNIPELQKTEDIIKPVVKPGCSIVLMQNGIGMEEPVMARYPDSYVIGAVSRIGSVNYGGNVRHTGPDRQIFGTYDKRPEAVEAAKRIAEIYGSGQKSIGEFTEELMYLRWMKLVYNSSCNTTAAVTDVDTGRLLYAGVHLTIILPAMREIRCIAEAVLGRKLPEDVEQRMLDSDGGTYYTPSMLVDVRKGQVMELEAILGNPLRYAAQQKIDTPILKHLYSLLRAKQFVLLEQRGYFEVAKEPFDRSKVQTLGPPLPWNN